MSKIFATREIRAKACSVRIDLVNDKQENNHMPEHADVSGNIGGTVIQRSFVASGIPRVIHIASVPASDLGVTNLSLEEIVAETLGVPCSSALTAEQYADLANYLATFVSLPAGFGPLSESGTASSFTEAYVSLLTPHFYVTGYPLMDFARDSRLREQVELPVETLHTALACLSARVSKTPEVDAFLKELLTYEIPIGQSPEVKGDSLLRILETTKSACVAPLLVGGSYGLTWTWGICWRTVVCRNCGLNDGYFYWDRQRGIVACE
jgi:hypothetical protein